MIKAVIIDDESHCLITLSVLLKENCPEVQLLQQCSSAKKGIEAIGKFQPDLVFMILKCP